MTPYLRVANVYDGRVDYDDVLFMNFSPAEREKFSVRRGDILLNEGQSLELVGRCALYDGPENTYCFQNTLVRFRHGPLLDPGFARAVFKRWLDVGHFMTIAKQTTSMAHLGAGRFARLELPLPSLSEQRRIVEILDTVNEAIHKTEQIIAKLKQLKQGLIHDLLTRGVDDNGELRDPNRHPEQFKDSPLGRVPKIWTISTVNDEFDITSGVTLGPHRVPTNHATPYLRVANVQRDALDLADIAYLEALDSEVENKRLVEGDLLVVEGHGNPHEIGRCAMASSAVRGFTFQNHLFRLRSRRAHPRFALRWMNSPFAQHYWHQVCSTSSGLNTINRSKLLALRMLMPSRSEQEAIVSRVDALDDRLDTETTAINKLRLLQQGLMEDLLAGRVRVTNTEDPQ